MIRDQQAVAVSDPFVRDLLEQLDAIMLDRRSLCDMLSARQLNWRPAPRRWSIAQNLEHITLTFALYPVAIRRMLAEAKARKAAGGGRYREGFIARRVVASQEPPPGLRIRTTRRVDPGPDLDHETVLTRFDDTLEQLRALIVASDGVPLDHARMQSPFVPLLRFTLRQVLQLNLAHTRRHLWQARQVRQHPSFPAA
jgi:hypothetical protein